MIGAMRQACRLVAIAWLALVAPSGASPAPVAHREVLPNGIVLLVAERPAVPIVSVRAYARAGSVFDPPGAAGLANLTADLLTRGTAKHSGEALDRAIEFVGGSLDADAGRDGTTVGVSVLRKDLDLGLDLLAEVVRAPTFPEAEVARRITELKAAIRRALDNPDSVASRELMRLVYAHHPYGHPVEGTLESVGALDRDRVLEFYRTYYRPDATIIAIVGAVTVAEARQAILSRFGGWERPGSAPPTVTASPPGPSSQTATIQRDLTQATVYLGRPAIRQTDPDYFPLVVANYILGGGSTSRLYMTVREEAGLAYAVGSHLVPGRYGAATLVTLQSRTSEVGTALEIVRREMRRMSTDPVSPEELDLAKSYLVGSFPLRLDTSWKVASFLLGVEDAGLGLDYAETFKRGVARVTADDVRRVAAHYLAPASFASVTVGNVTSASD
jgi:zinc protease